MTVFEKLNEARLRFQNAGVQKSGQNKFAGYTYYELSDILPEINKLANELKFCCVVNFTPELATLDFCDLEKDERITFRSPMSTASLKGCVEAQCLGGAMTYIKRYLYQNCFEIVESDMLETNTEIEEIIKQIKTKINTMTEEQKDYTNKAIAGRDINVLKAILSKMAK